MSPAVPLLEEDAGFHRGELAVQRRAGVLSEAAHLERMVGPGRLDGGVGRFLASASFGVLSARDHSGRIWVSPLLGSPGFLHVVDAMTLEVARDAVLGDPLGDLAPGQAVGLNVIEFSRRARVRVNGTLLRGGATPLVAVAQAYGNCPQYITPRRLDFAGVPEPADATRTADGAVAAPLTTLGPGDVELITAADTFFLGTSHPERGNDASHRGGPPGFVTVSGNEISWPDFPGNNMFNSLGNLEVNPEAALLFVDFNRSRALLLSGSGVVEWDKRSAARRVRFTVERAAATVLRRARDHPA